MSTATIADPSGTNPNQGYTNDLNLTQDMLMDLENSNISKSKGIFKVSCKVENDFAGITDEIATQDLAGGGTDTTSSYLNAIRFRLPFDVTYIGLLAAVGPYKTLDASNYFTIQAQKSTYQTSPIIPEAQWSNIGPMLTMNSTTSDNLVKHATGINENLAGTVWVSGASAPQSATFFRIKIGTTLAPEGTLQVTAVFTTEHI